MAALADTFARMTLDRARSGRLMLTVDGKVIGEVDQLTKDYVTVSVPTAATTFAPSEGSFHRPPGGAEATPAAAG